MNTLINDLKTEIKIMIEIIEDAEIQIQMRTLLEKNQTKGKEYLESMLDGLRSKNYVFFQKSWFLKGEFLHHPSDLLGAILIVYLFFPDYNEA